MPARTPEEAAQIVVHYLIAEPDPAKSALESVPGPTLPALVQKIEGLKTFGSGGRLVPACGLPTDRQNAKPKVRGDSGFFDGEFHRGTCITYAGVNCQACLESEAFQADKQPHPGDHAAVKAALAEVAGNYVKPCAGC